MASESIRDHNTDHLLTPKNCAFLIIATVRALEKYAQYLKDEHRDRP